MATWNSRGLRGSVLEELINRSNDKYREKNLALIQKIPYPHHPPLRMDKEQHHITLAYFDKKSTVDYIGIVQGIPVCFDAKECTTDTFPLQNIHEHQMEFMKQFEKQGGISFFIILFSCRDEKIYVPYRHVLKFWNRMKDGGRKSFRYEELDQTYIIRSHSGVMLHYLEQIKLDLSERSEKD